MILNQIYDSPPGHPYCYSHARRGRQARRRPPLAGRDGVEGFRGGNATRGGGEDFPSALSALAMSWAVISGGGMTGGDDAATEPIS